VSDQNCPSCGAATAFRNASTVMLTCEYCGSTILRTDIKLELLGKESAIIQDLSPIQSGTTGVYGNQGFTCLGRIQMSWQDGVWSEWYVAFNSGGFGWLAHAQGQYYFTQEVPHNIPLEGLEKATSQMVLNFPNHGTFKVSDIKKAKCTGLEGELPYTIKKGEEGLFIDLMNETGEFATIDVKGTTVKLYIGRCVEFEQLRFSGMRHIEGWS
jgi:hypothetical protein